MVSPKKVQKADLTKIAAQLASVRLLIVPGSERHTVRANVRFTTLSFDAGAYKVSVGLKQASLRLDHPSYEVENSYQATLPKELWSERWKNARRTKLGGKLHLRLRAKFLNYFTASAEGNAEKDVSESAEQNANTPYRIISASPSGWQIGTELGDPRDPEGTLPAGLEHCLIGVYFSGRSGEHGEGFKEKDGTFALCELRPKPGGNDPKIVATLAGSSGSVQVVVTPSESLESSLRARSEKVEREEALRKAFVDICLQRAEAASKDGARTELMLSGEIYLSHHEVHGPTLPSRPPDLNFKNRLGVQNATSGSERVADVKAREN